jgi:hypothetical protein
MLYCFHADLIRSWLNLRHATANEAESALRSTEPLAVVSEAVDVLMTFKLALRL